MPTMSAKKISDVAPGSCKMPNFMSLSESKPRQAFLKKYLTATPTMSVQEGQNATIDQEGELEPRIRNMVYANKKERIVEQEVCKYIVTRVLNEGNLSRITGITTQSELVRQELERKIEAKKLEQEERDRKI